MGGTSNLARNHQRVKKVHSSIEQRSEKILELMIKFNIKTNEQSIRDGGDEELPRVADPAQSLMDQRLVRFK